MYDRWFTIALLRSGFGQVWTKLGLKKLRTTLGEIVGLHNCVVADITPQLWHDVTPQQRLKCKEMDGGTNVMITYDATKMDGAYSDGIINNTPLFHQIFMNI